MRLVVRAAAHLQAVDVAAVAVAEDLAAALGLADSAAAVVARAA